MNSLVTTLMLCQIAVSSDVQYDLIRTWNAVCMVESGGDPYVKSGDGGRAVGIAQIHKICVDDCNRIMGKRKWSYADRQNPAKAFAMFKVYVRYYAPEGGPEQWARIWNGGPQGHKKAATRVYWSKVQKILQKKR